MEIDLQELKTVIDRLFDHVIETRGIKSVDFKHSNYWNIPFPDVYNAKQKPSDLDIGSSKDDWEFLSGLLKEDNQPVAYQFTEVAPLLRYLGEILGMDLAKDGG